MVAGWPAQERSGLRGSPAASMGREDPVPGKESWGQALTVARRKTNWGRRGGRGPALRDSGLGRPGRPGTETLDGGDPDLGRL